MYLYSASRIEILDIKDLKLKKYPGWDDIRSEILKELIYEIVDSITHKVKTCFSSQKNVIITPLIKGGNKNLKIILLSHYCLYSRRSLKKL